MSAEKNIRLKQRAGTSSDWKKGTGTLINKPVTLLENELGWETDTGRCKLGDGSTKWTDLPYTTSVYRGTGENSIEQELESIPGESLGITYFNFGDKNPNAAELDSSLKRITTRGAQGNYSVALGGISTALGDRSQAENEWCLAKGDDSHAEGDSTAALGYASHSEGYRTTAYGDYSHAEGLETVAEGNYSYASGAQSKATAMGAVAIQELNKASGHCSIALGYSTEASASQAIAGGYGSKATGARSVAIGENVAASGPDSVAFGWSTLAEGRYGFSAGNSNKAIGNASAVLGLLNTASGADSFAANGGNTASGEHSTAFGDNTVASGLRAFSLGHFSTASGTGAISGGYQSAAIGEHSIAIGQYSVANSPYSTAIGLHTQSSKTGGLTVGTYNDTSDTGLFQVGTGESGGSAYTTFSVSHKKATVNGELLATTLSAQSSATINGDITIADEAILKNDRGAKIRLSGDSIYLSDYVYADYLHANTLNIPGFDTSYISFNQNTFFGIADTEETIVFDTNVTINGHAGEYNEKMLSVNCPTYLSEASYKNGEEIATVDQIEKSFQFNATINWNTLSYNVPYNTFTGATTINQFQNVELTIDDYLIIEDLTANVTYTVPIGTAIDISPNGYTDLLYIQCNEVGEVRVFRGKTVSTWNYDYIRHYAFSYSKKITADSISFTVSAPSSTEECTKENCLFQSVVTTDYDSYELYSKAFGTDVGTSCYGCIIDGEDGTKTYKLLTYSNNSLSRAYKGDIIQLFGIINYDEASTRELREGEWPFWVYSSSSGLGVRGTLKSTINNQLLADKSNYVE